MTKKPLVSIVIPTYNRAGYLEQCINTALAQTYPCEIIVCDHGSTDNTPETVNKFIGKVKYVRRDIDHGVHFSWLDGIINATGEFVHINYDDDWIEPDFIERCMELFTEKVGFVFSDVRLFDENETFSEPKLSPFFKKTGIYSNLKLYLFETKNLISPGCAIFRRKVLLDSLFVGEVPFATKTYKGVGPDLLFSLMSTMDYSRFGYVNEPLAVFRAHSNSITVDASRDQAKQKKITDAYNDARAYFLISKFVRLFHLKSVFLLFLKITVSFFNVIKRIKR